VNENGAVYIGYDNRYRANSFSDPFLYGISYNYDSVGNRTALKVNGATYATYTYDATNRLTALKDNANLAFNYSYDAANRLTSRSAPNGLTTSYSYDDLNRLSSLMHTSGATTLSGNLYTYNNASNISSWITQTSQRAYTYDAADRLTGVTNFESPTESYTYDAVGNRTASHLSASYAYEPFNKLTSTANATYSYDSNGNVISKTDSLGTSMFAYDEENRLTQVTIPNGRTVNYKYDGLGQRIQRTTNGGANERYVYEGADVLIDLNSDGSVTTTYLNDRGIDNHLRQISSTSGVLYYLTDHLRSTSALADANGSLVESDAYDSFGNGPGSGLTRYTYTGREYDSDTKLFYSRSRWYDPQLGRFLSEDPITFIGGLNHFVYADNDPTDKIDPWGLQELPPLNRGNYTQIEIPRDQLERMMNPNGRLPGAVKRQLDRGCIGLASVYQGMGYPYPESAPGTQCYLAKQLAFSRKCTSCCTNFVFAIQGQWSGGRPRPAKGTGRIDNNSIETMLSGEFNYIIYFPSTDTYAWMDYGSNTGPQHGELSNDILHRSSYPNTIWCSTCKPKSGFGGVTGGMKGERSP
jgi:RHS repeat-associated protein